MEDMVKAEGFWVNKSCFVTGHTGFKGGWLSLWLEQLGARVFGYALPPTTRPNFFDLSGLQETMTSSLADVRSLEALTMAMGAAQPEVAFHLAAQPLVRESYSTPVETYEVNLMGAVHFLEAVRRTPSVQVAIIVTSDKCYENREWHWGYRETDRMGGHDPYSNSKGCVELITSAYRDSFLTKNQVQVATVRAGNVIGGGDWAEDRLIPDMVRAFSSAGTLHIRAPKAIRPWQHVLEPLCGYLMLAEKLWQMDRRDASAWNFGPSEQDVCSVAEVVKKAAAIWGEEVCWTVAPPPHPHETRTLKLDCSKARSLLGWIPVLDLDTALKWTIDWYKAQQAGIVDMRELTIRQIGAYEALARR